jgi:sortase A
VSYWDSDDSPTVAMPAVRGQYRSHRAKPPRSRRSSNTSRAPINDGPVRKTLRGIGELLITFGLVIMLFAGYEVWGKQIIVHKEQNHLNTQLQQQWAAPPKKADDAPPMPGDAMARIYIPRLGLNLIVVQGVTQDDLRIAPGHYDAAAMPNHVASAMPGQIGNFAVAGHREAGMFLHLDQLSAGDDIIIQTRTTWFVYTIYQKQIVLPTQINVVYPVPGRPLGTVPTKALITLTTCNPWWDNYQRLIIHGRLTSQQSTDDGKPKELGKLGS